MVVTLTGAFRNVGDHLIGQRASLLISRYLDPDIVNINRNNIRDTDYETMNRARAVLLCGGPAYQRNIFPGIYPLDLQKLEVPVIPLGLGWKDAVDSNPGDFEFSPASSAFIQEVHRNLDSSSCRDYLTMEVLKRIDVQNVVMTGCPAWYDLAGIERDFEVTAPRRIVVSDPARVSGSTLETLRFLRGRFPVSDITLALHHGYFSSFNRRGILFSWQHLRLAAFAKSIGFTVRGIAADVDAMRALYEHCDLHIGYRVHAHIYNLSRRTPSLLIAEDSRGVGQCDALGCKLLASEDAELIPRLSVEIESILDTGGAYFQGSLIAMRGGFTAMERFLQSIR